MPEDDADRRQTIESVREILTSRELPPTKEQLLEASIKLKQVSQYDYEVWRVHADLLLNAVRQLETRRLRPDENVMLFSAPLREEELRDAAEAALRQCAHLADSAEKRVAIVDEANQVRRTTWF